MYYKEEVFVSDRIGGNYAVEPHVQFRCTNVTKFFMILKIFELRRGVFIVRVIKGT